MDDVDVGSGLLTLRTDSFAEKLNDVSMETGYQNVEYLGWDLSNEEVGNPGDFILLCSNGERLCKC